MTVVLLFYFIFQIHLSSEDVLWNKYVNPFQNTSRISRYMRQLQPGSWLHDANSRDGLDSYHRKYVHSYSPDDLIHKSTSYHEPSPYQMDTTYSSNALVWTPNAFNKNTHKRMKKAWNSAQPYWEKAHSDLTQPLSDKPPFYLQALSPNVVWNEDGQFWGYGQQSNPDAISTESHLWPYDSDEALSDDSTCIPPFCIPVDCGDDSADGRRKCKRNPQVAAPCTGLECPANCSTGHPCIPTSVTCPSGWHGPQCRIMNASMCAQHYALHCAFGCTHVSNATGSLQCVCNPNIQLFNQTACIPVELEASRCPMGCSGRGECDTQTRECRCEPGFTGQGCEMKESCPQGLTGPTCRQDIDECLSGEGGCEQRCVNTYGSFRCECHNGYDIDPRDPRRCVRRRVCESKCVAGQGQCDEHDRCVCATGFDGEWCTDDVNECERRTHDCDQICVNTYGSYDCRCHHGYEAHPQNPKRCVPVECHPSCVTNQGLCSADRLCVCNPGFVGPDCGEDLDECAIGRHQCEQECVNTHGSYYCACKSGYKPDPSNPTRCLLDVCDPRCVDDSGSCYGRRCMNGVCHTDYTSGTPITRCECQPGYEGLRCEQDIDECSPDSLVHRHHCSQLCHNTPGSYVCACYSGFVLQPDGRTCVRESQQCGDGCLNGGLCLSTGQCKCPPNFDGPRCEFESNLCQKLKECEHICLTEQDGTYRCACRVGFHLADDGRSCTLSESCQLPCLNGAQCFRGRCLCRSGFEGLQCELDADECALPPAVHGCVFECRNTYGSYECICPNGFHRLADKRTCVRSPTGTQCHPPCQNGGVCRADNQCDCLRGYRGPDCSEDINECEELRPCDPEFATCVNIPGSFECVCQPGYRLMVDARHCIDDSRARHAPHLLFRGRSQKGVVVANRVVASTNPLHSQGEHVRTLRRRRTVQHARKLVPYPKVYTQVMKSVPSQRTAGLKGDPRLFVRSLRILRSPRHNEALSHAS